MLTFGHATRDYYLHVREKQMTALEMERQNSGGGGDGKKYYKRVMQWNGIKYTSLAFNAFHDKKYLMRKSPRR